MEFKVQDFNLNKKIPIFEPNFAKEGTSIVKQRK